MLANDVSSLVYMVTMTWDPSVFLKLIFYVSESISSLDTMLEIDNC